MRVWFRRLADVLDVIAILTAVAALAALASMLGLIGTGAFTELGVYLLLCLAIPAAGAAAADRIGRR